MCEIGSSMIRTVGLRTIARAIATRCFCPPDNSRGFRLRMSPMSSVATARWSSRFDLGFAHPPHFEREYDVLSDREVWVERIVLKDHRDITVGRFHVVDNAFPDRNGAAADRLQPRDHPHRRRLAAAGGADDGKKLAVCAIEGQVAYSLDLPPALLVDLPDTIQATRAIECPAPRVRPLPSVPGEPTPPIDASSAPRCVPSRCSWRTLPD